MDMIVKFALPGVAFLTTLAFGFWVSHVGKPYNGILFNIHKLVALAAVILMVIQFVGTFKTINVTTVLIIMLVLSGICVVALFASGALMSASQFNYPLLLTIHRVAPVLLVIGIGLVVYLVAKIG